MQQFPVLLFIIHRTSSNESPSLITAEATIAAYHCRIVVADDATMKSSSYRVDNVLSSYRRSSRHDATITSYRGRIIVTDDETLPMMMTICTTTIGWAGWEWCCWSKVTTTVAVATTLSLVYCWMVSKLAVDLLSSWLSSSSLLCCWLLDIIHY